MVRILAAGLFLMLGTPAFAACLPPVSGSLPEAIAANAQRLVCLQDELAAETRQRQLEFDLRALQDAQQDIQLQQRLDALPQPYVPRPAFQ